MQSKKQLALGLGLLLLGLGAVFLLLNFRVARSKTEVESQVSTYSAGFEKGESLPAEAPLTLVVEGQDSLAQTLARRLERKFLAGPVTEVTLEEAVQENIEHFQVVVEVTERSLVWSPFYAQARLAVHFSFSSNGNLSWRDSQVFEMTSEDGQLVGVSGDLQLSDTTFGLVSRPAYQSHLADELAWRIEEAILKALSSPMNPALGSLP